MNFRDPEAWIDAAMETVPVEHRESFGQMQAIREYGDCIRSLPEAEQERLWSAFNRALDKRFPSRLLPSPAPAETPRPAPVRATDEQIVENVLPVFHAPGDHSPEFHEVLFNRAMGMVDSGLSQDRFLSRIFRRRRIAARIRRWMREEL